jgi:hypothetical protein
MNAQLPTIETLSQSGDEPVITKKHTVTHLDEIKESENDRNIEDLSPI